MSSSTSSTSSNTDTNISDSTSSSTMTTRGGRRRRRPRGPLIMLSGAVGAVLVAAAAAAAAMAVAGTTANTHLLLDVLLGNNKNVLGKMIITIMRSVPTKTFQWFQVDFRTNDPVILSQSFLVSILMTVISIKFWQSLQKRKSSMSRTGEETDGADTDTTKSNNNNNNNNKPEAIRQLQWKFLSVFWLLRVAFWMAGPYFYAAFASKTIKRQNFNGNQQQQQQQQQQPMPVRIISQVSLTGYAAIALLGPPAANIAQIYGTRVATIVGMVCYGLGSWSVTSNSLPVLFLGRAVAGVGQSFLSNAPESWFVSEAKKQQLQEQEQQQQQQQHEQQQQQQHEQQRVQYYLGETFGLAYSLDSVVAIVAGQIAQLAAASHRGPTGPFFVSPFFLVLAAVVVMLFWSEEEEEEEEQQQQQKQPQESRRSSIIIAEAVLKEEEKGEDGGGAGSSNSKKKTTTTTTTTTKQQSHSIQETVRIIFADPKIVCLGIVQSIFEAAMYIFVLAWAPLMTETIQYSCSAVDDGNDQSSSSSSSPSSSPCSTPFGMIFSCFMAACMLGSTVFSVLMSSQTTTTRTTTTTAAAKTTKTTMRLEVAVSILLAAASFSLISSLLWSTNTNTDSSTIQENHHGTSTGAVFKLFLSYLGFEACVGMYFPSIGTLRARILPDSHRSVIMTLFAVPLNVMVVTVFLLLDKLGHRGGIAVAAVALGLATLAMITLDRLQQRAAAEEEERLRRRKEQEQEQEHQQEIRDKFKKMVRKAYMLSSVCTEFSSQLMLVGGTGQVYTSPNGECDVRSSRSSFGMDCFPMACQ